MQQTFRPFLPFGIEEMGRQNIAMMERAMSLFNPFHRPSDPSQPVPAQPDPAVVAEVERLHREIESLRCQLAAARADAVMAQVGQDVAAHDDEAPVPSETPGRHTARPRKGSSQWSDPDAWFPSVG